MEMAYGRQTFYRSRVHIWNSYFTSFSSCSPSGTLNPTHASRASCTALFHLLSSFTKSGMKTSHSKPGEMMRVNRMRSTTDEDVVVVVDSARLSV